MITRWILTILTISMASALTGCGFQLRGLNHSYGDGQSFPFSAVHVDFEYKHVKMQSLLESALRRSGVTVLDAIAEPDAEEQPSTTNTKTPSTSPDGETMRLVITDVSETRRTVALNSAAKAAEYELKTTTTFHLVSIRRGTTSKPATVTVLKNFSNDPDQVSGKMQEERMLQEEMLYESVARIIQRLQGDQQEWSEPPSANGQTPRNQQRQGALSTNNEQ